MTDTTTLAPTDAEILNEWDRVSCITFAGQRRLAFARAVLAKWGAPAPASGEVVVTCAPDGRCVAVTRQDEEGRILSVIWVEPAQEVPALRTAAQALIDRWDTPRWKDAEHTGAFIHRLREALAAPPAQEARVPLTPEQRDEIYRSARYEGSEGWEVDSNDVIDAVEKYHGIGITAAQKETP